MLVDILPRPKPLILAVRQTGSAPHVIPSKIQRTDRNRVSSIPSRLVESAPVATSRPSRRGLCARSAIDNTPYSAGRSVTGRFAARDRRRQLVPETLGHSGSYLDRGTGLSERPPRTQRLTARQPAFAQPQLDLLTAGGQVLDPHQLSVLHRRAEHAARRARPFPADLFDDHLHADGPSDPRSRRRTRPPDRITPPSDRTTHSDNTWKGTTGSIRHARGPAAGRCERPEAFRGHEPNTGYDTSRSPAATPLKIEEPVNPGLTWNR